MNKINYLVSFDLRPVDGRKSFYGKAQVIRANGCMYLKSYNTIVAMIDEYGRFTRMWWGYSATTMRHINAFIAMYDLSGGGKSWWYSLPLNIPVKLVKAV